MGSLALCGPIGSGQVMKLANNAMAIGTFGLLMEVREMVAAQGMELDTFMEFLNRSTGRSFVSENWPMPPTRITFSGMPVKDMRRCAAAADDVDVAMPMLERLLEAGADDHEGPA
ncbi:MAG: NAD-binding protein [Actinomycetota bacterium]